jgi:hypothetical protein
MVLAAVLALTAQGLPLPVAAAKPAPASPRSARHVIRHQMQQLAPNGGVPPAAAAPRRSLAPSAPTATWTPLGPQPILGLSTYGASAGRVTALAAQGLIVYAGAADGGVWKSTDSGSHWAALADSQATLAIGAIAVDWTTTPETVYAGTGEANHCQDCLPSQGVLKSTDGGATWALLAQTTFTAQHFGFEGLVVDHPAGVLLARLLAATNHGLYRSTDAGTTWSVVLAGETSAIVQDPVTTTKFWAAQADAGCQSTSMSNPLYGSIAMSLDSGATWTTTKIFSGLPEAIRIGLGVGATATTDVAYAALAACPTNGPPAYALGQLSAIEKTTDPTGATWATLSPPSDYFSTPPPVAYQGWFDNVVAVEPSNPLHAVFGGISMLVTTDGGTTLTDVAKPYTTGTLHPDFHAVAFPGPVNTFYVANDGGVSVTSNLGGTGTSNDWTNKSATLSISQFYHGSAPDLNHVIGGSQDNGTAGIVPGGPAAPAWASLLDGDGGWTAQIPNSTTVYVEVSGLDIFQVNTSTGLITEVAPCSSPYTDPSCNDPVGFVAPFVRDPSSGNGVERLYAATNRVYRTANGGLPAGGTRSGAPWTAVSNDLTAGTVNLTSGSRPDFINTMAIGSGATSGTVITGSWFGKVWMTTNGPTVTSTGWTNITGDLPPFSQSAYTGNAWISGVAVNPTNSSEAWATIGVASGARVFHTTNAGAAAHWTDITGAMPSVVVDSLTVDPLNPSTVYVGTDTGPLWCSTCGGNVPSPSWVTLGAGLPNARVEALTLTADASSIIAWTHGRGAWSLSRPLPTPQAKLNPTSLSFGGQKVGATSAPQSITLSNDGSGPLTISGISVTGDFSQTNTCGSVLAAATSCTISVTFTPSGAGTRIGTVSVSDNAANTPQTASLSGVGVSPWETLGGGLLSGPDASSWGTNREDVFIRGQDNALWYRTFNGTSWTGWQSLGGIITADPGAVSWGTNRIDVLIRGQDRQLWHRSFDGSTWTGWEPLGGILASGPDVASPAPGRLDVFIQGQDNQLWQKSFINGSWTGWQPLGGIITAAPTAVSAASNQIDVLARGQDRQLWHRSFDGTAWTGWEPLGGILAAGPDASSWGSGRLDVFIEGQDQQLWHIWRASGSWSGWQPLGGVITDSPGAVSPTTGVIDVFARGQDFALWHLGLTG